MRHFKPAIEGGHGDGVKTPPHGVHYLGEGDAVFLRSRGIAPFKLKIDLAQPHLTFNIPSSHQGGVAHLRIHDVFKGFQTHW
jgi:hypothetical protein